MDFDLRQWLLVLGPMVIAAVLVHGYIRMRASQNQIKMKLDKAFVSQVGESTKVDDFNLLKGELPNGGARVIERSDPLSDMPVLEETSGVPAYRISGALEIEESVGVGPLSDNMPFEERVTLSVNDPKARRDIDLEPFEHDVISPPDIDSDQRTEVISESAVKSTELPEMFVVINVLSLADPFRGEPLLEILVEGDMTFGEMDIFHRQVDGEIRFSLANAVEPGTFDLAAISEFSTPGVTMFMRVHELRQPVVALDEMLAVADAIALELGGEVRDETRSVMTPQTIEHCRESIREFQFKHAG